ncbi:MAG: zf-HC2 domain-containing protein [Gemmatimonadota bacterium]|nr:zf-HC2 domain-containing protein [Gemmatimonadota bacterium]
MGEHPSTEEVAAYLSDGLAPDSRLALEAHIAECRRCRTEISSARRLMESGRSKKWQWAVPSALAAAAAIAFFSTSSSLREPEEPTRAADRASSGSAVNLGIVSPADEAIVAGVPVFTWRADGSEVLYKFSVTDAGGAVIWVGETKDTSLSLPADVSLDANREYLWHVDAVDPEGATVTTGTHRFRILR